MRIAAPVLLYGENNAQYGKPRGNCCFQRRDEPVLQNKGSKWEESVDGLRSRGVLDIIP